MPEQAYECVGTWREVAVRDCRSASLSGNTRDVAGFKSYMKIVKDTKVVQSVALTT